MTILDQDPVQELEYASFGERLIARIIDGFILIIPSIFVPFLASWLYSALQEGSESGATIGKRAMNIRVLGTDNRPIGFGAATGRFFGNFLDIVTLGFGYILMLFNSRSQCLHDMVAGTIVVKTNSYSKPATAQRSTGVQARKWTSTQNGETHTVEIDRNGGRHWIKTASSEQVSQFTLWQLTDDMVDLSQEFAPEVYQEMQQFAEMLMRQSA